MSPYICSLPNISDAYHKPAEEVTTGVSCEVCLPVDSTYDLGVVVVEPGYSTPEQTVMEPNSLTIQILIECDHAELRVVRADGKVEYYTFTSSSKKGTAVEIYYQDTMQWLNLGDYPLVFLEECHPPFNENRYRNNS